MFKASHCLCLSYPRLGPTPISQSMQASPGVSHSRPVKHWLADLLQALPLLTGAEVALSCYFQYVLSKLAAKQRSCLL